MAPSDVLTEREKHEGKKRSKFARGKTDNSQRSRGASHMPVVVFKQHHSVPTAQSQDLHRNTKSFFSSSLFRRD